MNAGGEAERSFSEALQKFCEECGTDRLSLEFVRQSLAALSLEFARQSIAATIPGVSGEEFRLALQRHSLLHNVCANELVSAEVVEEILAFCPDAVTFTHTARVYGEPGEINQSWPLHAACRNEGCPLSVIELLVKKHPIPLMSLGMFGRGLRKSGHNNITSWGIYDVSGTPLHYYLERTADLTLEGVKLLVKACPKALQMADRKKRLSPLHTLALNPTLSEHLDIVQFLVRSDPSLLKAIDCPDFSIPGLRCAGCTPLHMACRENSNVTLEIVQFLVESWPDSIHACPQESDGGFPLHYLCQNRELDDSTAMEIMKYLVGLDAGTVDSHTDEATFPIHFAAGKGCRNRAFCEYLVDQFPGSVNRGNANRCLPFQEACGKGRLETVEYFLGVTGEGGFTLQEARCSPGALNVRSLRGFLPVHEAVFNGCQRSEIFDFLLSQDPDCLSKRVRYEGEEGHFRYPLDDGSGAMLRFDGGLPLHLMVECNCPGFEVGSRVGASWVPLRERHDVTVLTNCPDPEAGVKYLFDAYPEAIVAKNDLGHTPVDLAFELRPDFARSERPDLLPFLEVQQAYALKARSVEEVKIVDGDGRLLLHRAILDVKASLGAIKLLAKANPEAFRVRDNNGLIPVQLACQHSTSDIVQYLIEQDESALRASDADGNNLLHLACRAGNSGAVNFLAEKCPSLVSAENGSGALPVHLLCDKAAKSDATLESVEYTEAVWRLLLAEPSQLALEKPVNREGKMEGAR